MQPAGTRSDARRATAGLTVICVSGARNYADGRAPVALMYLADAESVIIKRPLVASCRNKEMEIVFSEYLHDTSFGNTGKLFRRYLL